MGWSQQIAPEYLGRLQQMLPPKATNCKDLRRAALISLPEGTRFRVFGSDPRNW